MTWTWNTVDDMVMSVSLMRTMEMLPPLLTLPMLITEMRAMMMR